MNENYLWHEYLSETGFNGYDGLCRRYQQKGGLTTNYAANNANNPR